MIPGYTQTISKKRFPYGKGMPEYITSAYECRVIDQEGKEYIDWTASLGAIIRGYYPFDGYYSCLPMKTKSEDNLADLLCEITKMDCVRFFKTGSDACTAAVRLSQKITGRRKIFSYGYHGWHDWTLLQNNDLWEIEDICTDRFLTLLKAYKPACLILEPVSRSYPLLDWKRLDKIRDICRIEGIVFILDQILWGFRTSLEGCAMSTNPDLVCYGKAMSNGLPISALVGRKDIMEDFDITGITGTYFSDDYCFKNTISNIYTLLKFDYCDFSVKGVNFSASLSRLIDTYNLNSFVSVKYFGPWCAFEWEDKIMQHLFIQELIKKGILFNRDFFLMGAHTGRDIDKTLKSCDEVFKFIEYNLGLIDLNTLITTNLRIEL